MEPMTPHCWAAVVISCMAFGLSLAAFSLSLIALR